MSDLILTLHAGHNASAAIGDRSRILYGVQEERLRGEKNYWGFPSKSIEAALREAGAKPSDVAAIAVGTKQVFSRYHSREDLIESYRRQETLTGKLRQRMAVPLMMALQPTYGQGSLASSLEQLGLTNVPITHYDHHTAHAATAYYGLRKDPERPYLVVTCDGEGDGNCATVRVFERGVARDVAATNWANSLGAVYSWITYGMGFVPLEHEYKLMGMAPYASDSAAEEIAHIFKSYLWLDESGLQFQRSTLRRTNDLAEGIFGDLKGKRFDHICAGLQRFTEDLLCTWIANAVRATGVKHVLAAGGVFMNVKANKRIGELPEVEYFEAFPSCGDETLPFGAYYLKAAERYGAPEVRPLEHFYFGDDITSASAEEVVKKSGFPYVKPVDIASAVAELLTKGQPVARCAGRMEFGARALGNRSILGDPSNQDLVRVVNQMVKKRDFWMPFAPMVLSERQDEYVKNPKKLRSPFMMMTFDTKENFRDFIAAVHNADLTCRAQVLERHQNPAMHDIVRAFEKKTGRGIILNTSFNLHGFPIVRTPDEALHVFRESGLEYLQVGDFIVWKK
jgi:carbamoyltransferase